MKWYQWSSGYLYNGVWVEGWPTGFTNYSPTNTWIQNCPSNWDNWYLVSPKNYWIKWSNSNWNIECPSDFQYHHYISSTSSEWIKSCPPYSVALSSKPSSVSSTSYSFPLCLDCQSQFWTSWVQTQSQVSQLSQVAIWTGCNSNNGVPLFLNNNSWQSSWGLNAYM